MTRKDPLLVARARRLRNSPTLSEQRLWRHLRTKRFAGRKFRRQQVVDRYIVDFCSLETRVIVELDGPSHTGREGYDQTRAKYLEAQGFVVCRFSNEDVDYNMRQVLDKIHKACRIAAPRKRPGACKT